MMATVRRITRIAGERLWNYRRKAGRKAEEDEFKSQQNARCREQAVGETNRDPTSLTRSPALYVGCTDYETPPSGPYKNTADVQLQTRRNCEGRVEVPPPAPQAPIGAKMRIERRTFFRATSDHQGNLPLPG